MGESLREEELSRTLDELVELGIAERVGSDEFRLSGEAVREVLEDALEAAIKMERAGEYPSMGVALASGCILAYLRRKRTAGRSELFRAAKVMGALIAAELRR